MSALVGEEMGRAHTRLNGFLIDFLDRALPQLPWELAPRSFLQRLLDLPPRPVPGSAAQSAVTAVTAVAAPTASTASSLLAPTQFCEDTEQNFLSTVLLGAEHHLVVCYAALWALCDVLFGLPLVSALVVFLVDRLVLFCCAHWGRVNLAHKTLIDERFLG